MATCPTAFRVLNNTWISILALSRIDAVIHQAPWAWEKHGTVKVNEKLVERPPRCWAPVRREPAMLGISNGRQPQFDNTLGAASRFRWSARRTDRNITSCASRILNSLAESRIEATLRGA